MTEITNAALAALSNPQQIAALVFVAVCILGVVWVADRFTGRRGSRDD